MNKIICYKMMITSHEANESMKKHESPQSIDIVAGHEMWHAVHSY